MELLIAIAVGWLTAIGVYLTLRRRVFPVIVGMSLLSYAVNVFLFATGGVRLHAPPLLSGKVPDPAVPMTDPLPQALVLTAIVISFGMTAVMVMMALGAYFQGGDDRIDLGPEPPEGMAVEAARANPQPQTAAMRGDEGLVDLASGRGAREAQEGRP